MKVRLFIGTFLFIIGLCTSANAQTSGQVMFVGFNADGNDGFAFAALVDIPANTTIYFNDNEWNGSPIGGGGAFNTGEGSLTWQNNTGSVIVAGTVVIINNVSTSPAATLGNIVSGTIAMSGTAEVVYMFLGTDSSTPITFLSAIANNGFSAGNGQLTNTGLAVGVNAVEFTGSEDVIVYLNNINCNSTVTNCAATIANTSNWDSDDGGGNQSNNGTFPDFPANVCDVAGTLFFPMATYYSLASGAWDSNTSWSLSSDGSTGAVPAGVWPRRTDNVVIRNTHTITINAVDDNKSCGNSPNGLNRSNVSAFTGSADLMFYHTGDILISNGGTLISTEEIMIEGYTHVENGGALNVNEDIINLGYFEVSASTTFSNTDDLILSGNSITIINNTSTGFDDIYIDHTDATLCGTGVMNIGNGSPDPTIQYFNGASINQICSTFTVTCSMNCPGGFPVTGTGNSVPGILGPAGIGATNGSSPLKLWFRPDNGVVSSGGLVDSWANSAGIAALDVSETTTQRPTVVTGAVNGFSEISFSGTNRLRTGLTLTTSNFVNDQASTFTVVRADNTTQNSSVFLTDPLETNRFSNHIPWSNVVYYDIGSCCTNNSRLNVTGLTGLTSYSIWAYDANPSSGKQLYRNGTLLQSRANTSTYTSHATHRFNIGANTTGSAGFQGDVAEIIIFNSKVNTAQRILIDNYLSAKYNIALSANDVYTMDDPGNGNYDFEVAGIGQATDASYHRDAQGSGVVRMWNPKDLANSEFLMWGHDNTALNSSTTAVGTAVDGTVIQERLSRIWRVSEVGDVGNVSISFDFSGVGGSPLGSNLRLLIDRDGDGFADNDVTPIVGSVSNGIAVFSNVNFVSGDRFTLGNTDASAPLPIELVMFKASAAKDAVKLNWTTASELNNDYFNVERSLDGEQWQLIATVAGAGTTNRTNAYETIDYQPIEGVSYYRLRQTDFDGEFSFSPIERVNFTGENTMQVFPNPSNGIFYLANSPQLDVESIRVLNSLGQMVFPLIQKEGDISVDLSQLPNGIYILQVWNGSSLTSRRLVKRN
ncbi:MAG: T9SS type A sorting domain-containing protein [Cyclobacteriaceae bacterium]